MKIIDLSDSEALELCMKEEDHTFDKKAFGINGKKVQKIGCAFANSDGGTLVIVFQMIKMRVIQGKDGKVLQKLRISIQ